MTNEPISWKNGRRAAGIAWTRDGTVCAVLVETARGVPVLSRTAFPAQKGAAGIREALGLLRLDTETLVIAGGAEPVGAQADLRLPALPRQGIRGALSFHLPQISLLAPSETVWGFRILEQKPDGILVRLACLPVAEWEAWAALLREAGVHADAIIPPSLVPDPLLAGVPITIPAPYGCLRLNPLSQGGRELVPETSATTGANALDVLIRELSLQVSEAGLNERLQRQCLPAVLLALHGLSGQAAADAETWIPVPADLRPTRNVWVRNLFRGLAAMAACLLVGLAAVEGGRRWQYHNALETAMAKAKQQVAAASGNGLEAEQKLLAKLESELKEATRPTPSLAEVMDDLTARLDNSLWIESLEWHNGRITAQIRMQAEKPDLVRSLELSPLLSNVTPGGRRQGSGSDTIFTVTMNTGYEEPGKTQGGE